MAHVEPGADVADELAEVNRAKRAAIRLLRREIADSYDRQLCHEKNWLRSHREYPIGSFERYHAERRDKTNQIRRLCHDIASLTVKDNILMPRLVTEEECRRVEQQAMEEQDQ